MASRPCAACGNHGVKCKCARAGAQKRKPASAHNQAPAAKRPAAKRTGARTGAAGPPRMKASDIQRLVVFREVCKEFRGDRLSSLKKFDAPDGSCARLHMANMSDEDVKKLARLFRCNVFRVKHTGRVCADYKNKPHTVECVDEKTPYCFEGYDSTTLYVDGVRPYCFGCGGESRAFRKRAGAQTYSCSACKIEFTKKMCANVFARLGPLKAMAEEHNMAYKPYLRELVNNQKVVLQYDDSSAASAAAPVWEWSQKNLPGGSRVDPKEIASKVPLSLFQGIRCRDGRKCIFEFKGASKRLLVQREWLGERGIDASGKVLFHGCPFDVLPNILMGGFQNAGTTNAKAYGQGVYFAKDPNYSLCRQYSRRDKDGNRVLLVCAVIIGKVHETTGRDTMLPVDCRTGGNVARGIYMKPFANLADVVIAYAIVWQE